MGFDCMSSLRFLDLLVTTDKQQFHHALQMTPGSMMCSIRNKRFINTLNNYFSLFTERKIGKTHKTLKITFSISNAKFRFEKLR